MNLDKKIKEYERKAKESRQIANYLRELKQYRDRKDNPKPKTGHWILCHPLQEDDPGAYICSVCRHGDWGLDPKIDKFCFNCGARMVESEEEE